MYLPFSFYQLLRSPVHSLSITWGLCLLDGHPISPLYLFIRLPFPFENNTPISACHGKEFTEAQHKTFALNSPVGCHGKEGRVTLGSSSPSERNGGSAWKLCATNNVDDDHYKKGSGTKSSGTGR